MSDLSWLIDGEGSSYYDLTANYFDNFDKDKENNVESVFEIQYSDVNPSPAGDGDFDVEPNLGLNRGQFLRHRESDGRMQNCVPGWLVNLRKRRI